VFQLNGRGAVALLAGPLAALAVAMPAHAQSADIAQASSNPVDGLRYESTSADNDIRVTLAGTSFIVDDNVPIQAGPGCAAIPGDATVVKCAAPKQGNKFKPFFVSGHGGEDTIRNLTSTDAAAGAPMTAAGDQDDDTLLGDPKVRDVLLGGNGSDHIKDSGGVDNLLDGASGNDLLRGGPSNDTLRGGSGRDSLDGRGGEDQLDGGTDADRIDGGDPGVRAGERHDRVVYLDRSQPVRIDLSQPGAPQGEMDANGHVVEGDIIVNVEDAFGGKGDDTLIGNEFGNTLTGFDGDDDINGMAGSDVLVGGDGADTLSPSAAAPLFGVQPDGVADLMEGGNLGVSDPDAGDIAIVVTAEDDFANDCPTVFQQ
jgi:hypothetical protein